MRITIDHKVIEPSRHISQEEILNEFETVQEAVKDPKQFQILYDRYFSAIFNYVYRKIDDEEITAEPDSDTAQAFNARLEKLESGAEEIDGLLEKLGHLDPGLLALGLFLGRFASIGLLQL